MEEGGRPTLTRVLGRDERVPGLESKGVSGMRGNQWLELENDKSV